MRLARWLDHLPPWISCGALASTGVFEPGEVAGMVAPLVAAALVEARSLDLGRWRRGIELSTLGFILLDALRRPGLIPVVVHALFLLCAARLILPRGASQRKQILLMAFLLFLVTSLTSMDLSFMAWGLAWTTSAAAVLLQISWEQSAHFRRGPVLSPPFLQILPWSLASLLLAAGFFVILPRVALGLRPFSWGITSLGGGQAGFSDHLDLSGGGTIAPNTDVVIRIVPPKDLPLVRRLELDTQLSLLRGLALDAFDGKKWESDFGQWRRLPGPPRLPNGRIEQDVVDLEFHISPTPRSILPLPYGAVDLHPPMGLSVRADEFTGALRWSFPVAGRQELGVRFKAGPLAEPAPRGRSLQILTNLADREALAGKWSRLLAPDQGSPYQLGTRLAEALRSRFQYTLENPSAKASDPLFDFLERSHAGHCEYFASALALMLRARGIPARVVNGYRLGPWINEGGYWLVTQNEAHSWVEFFDSEHGWCVADSTPPAPPSSVLSPTFSATLERWVDTIRFKWDRHVVRFSGDDQQAGLTWVQEKASSLQLPDLRKVKRSLTSPRGIGSILVPLALAWFLWRTRFHWRRLLRSGRGPTGLAALKPLLRRATPYLEPGEGETARSWLLRLSRLRPDRQAQLGELAGLVDSVAYDRGPEDLLRQKVREEARVWKRK